MGSWSSFNPRSHEGNDWAGCTILTLECAVSIHVPTRGTTSYRISGSHSAGVSIHVPTRGTTRPDRRRQAVTRVSIHVPTRGTTILMRISTGKKRGFNPRSHEGNDIASVPVSSAPVLSFNPRSHEGNDTNDYASTMSRGVSIHVPTRGTTNVEIANGEEVRVSIHVPTRGTTGICLPERYWLTVSLHGPTRGTTSSLLYFV